MKLAWKHAYLQKFLLEHDIERLEKRGDEAFVQEKCKNNGEGRQKEDAATLGKQDRDEMRW